MSIYNKLIKYFYPVTLFDKIEDLPVSKFKTLSIIKKSEIQLTEVYWNIFLTNIKKYYNYYFYKKENDYDSFLLECPICLEKNKTYALIGCGHTFCDGCKNNLKICPICRNPVNGYMKIYI
jgi:hypothetical protein